MAHAADAPDAQVSALRTPRAVATRFRLSPVATAAAVACGLASAALLLPQDAAWMATWPGILDLFVSLWIALFMGQLALYWSAMAVRSALAPPIASAAAGVETATASTAPRPVRALGWALLLLAVCGAELATHAGERNGFLASSRPTSGVETWTTADGYAVLLDGLPAQGDGLFLLPMLGLFLGDSPPAPSEFDRRAGHVYLVSLLARPLGTYWAFAAVNLLSWWAAALAVWWLGRRRWPGTATGEIASLLTAAGLGFVFMGAAPQAHAAAFGAFALVLALCERLDLWRPRAGPLTWAKAGWAAGAAGLLYLVYLPCLLFFWLYGGRRSGPLRLVGPALAAVVALGLVTAWQIYGSVLLGLSFSGGNNDLAGQALAGWRDLAGRGIHALIGQLHAGSLRGLAVAAFYYPWWLLAALGYAASGADNRRWALAVLAAAAIPAIAFSTRFHLPRLAYFAFPAVYLLAARGIEVLAARLGGPAGVGAADLASAPSQAGTGTLVGGPGGPGDGKGSRISRRAVWSGTEGNGPARARWVVIGAAVALLALLTNLDLFGVQQVNLWFHYSQGTTW